MIAAMEFAEIIVAILSATVGSQNCVFALM